MRSPPQCCTRKSVRHSTFFWIRTKRQIITVKTEQGFTVTNLSLGGWEGLAPLFLTRTQLSLFLLQDFKANKYPNKPIGVHVVYPFFSPVYLGRVPIRFITFRNTTKKFWKFDLCEMVLLRQIWKSLKMCNWKKKRKKKERRVRLSRTGCEWSPIHRCYPTTIWGGSFCLLCFHPGPVRSSLTNLENSDSSVFTILTPNLARTPDLHRTAAPRNPALKPFNDPSLQVTGLQACATTPGWRQTNKFNRSIVTSLDCPPEVKRHVLEDQNTSRFLPKTQRKRKATNIYLPSDLRLNYLKASWI